MADGSPGLHPVTVVGVVGGELFGPGARDALASAQVLVGASRHLAWFGDADGRVRVEIRGPLDAVVDQIDAHRHAGRSVCVLASGDPGFFGIVRVLGSRLGPDAVRVWPAPSSVALAWGAAGMHWDDADVVSAHGRALAEAIPHVLRSPKVAVLTDPSSPPERLGQELVARGCGPRRVVVASRLGEADERVTRTDLAGLAAGTFDPLSVVLLIGPEAGGDGPSISWGRPESEFAHRAGMITKSEVRAVALAKLSLPRAGVLWDVGAGSGSVGIEAATIAPRLQVIAIERDANDAPQITVNADAAGVTVDVVVGGAPDALAALPDPDRVFVGGGGLDVVESCWARLRQGGVLVATFVVLDRALAAQRLLGDMVQIQVNRCIPIGDVGVRLEPLNPVFVAWGQR